MPISGTYRVQAFLGLIYVCAGSAKLLGADIMVEAFGVTVLGHSLRIAVGVLEIGGGLCLFIPRAAIYAAVVLGCTIIGILGAAVGHVARLSIDQQPYMQGYLAVSLLNGYLRYGLNLPQRPLLTGPAVIDAANVDSAIAGAKAGVR